jgi:hypothetical protein
MAKFPSAIDDASSLFTPVDAFQSKPLETTATNAIGAGNSTISVESTSVGLRRLGELTQPCSPELTHPL